MYQSGCLVCGAPLVYYESGQALSCSFCGRQGNTNAACKEGHYVCDGCHSKNGLDAIRDFMGAYTGKNPVSAAKSAMGLKYINIHGPEHHFLVAAVLIGTYINAGGQGDLDALLDTARERASAVPGGICGHWGSCGAAIGAGIYISVVTGASPLSIESWRIANETTALCLLEISKNGGPRCCKRNTFLSVLQAVAMTRQYFGVEMETPDQIFCGFFPRNKQCRKNDCIFFPVNQSIDRGY